MTVVMSAQSRQQKTLTSTTCPGSGCLSVNVRQFGAIGIQVGTVTGTIQFEGTLDETTYSTVNCTPPNSTISATNTTSSGIWTCGVGGLLTFRLRASSLTGSVEVSALPAATMGKMGGSGGEAIIGADTQVLFFDGANNPAGDAGLTYDKTTDALAVGPNFQWTGATGLRVGDLGDIAHETYVGTPQGTLPTDIRVGVNGAKWGFGYYGDGVNAFGGLEVVFGLTTGSGGGNAGGFYSWADEGVAFGYSVGVFGKAGLRAASTLADNLVSAFVGFVDITNAGGTIAHGSAFRAVDKNVYGDAVGTLTTQTGFRCDDLSAGTNNNCVFSVVTSGANKYFLRHTGDAQSLIGGALDLVAAGVRFSAADGVLTLLGLGNGNDENLTIDFDNAAANVVAVGTGTGVTKIDFGTLILEAAFNSSDGTAGLTQTCTATVVALTIKNGLITSVTCP